MLPEPAVFSHDHISLANSKSARSAWFQTAAAPVRPAGRCTGVSIVITHYPTSVALSPDKHRGMTDGVSIWDGVLYGLRKSHIFPEVSPPLVCSGPVVTQCQPAWLCSGRKLERATRVTLFWEYSFTPGVGARSLSTCAVGPDFLAPNCLAQG